MAETLVITKNFQNFGGGRFEELPPILTARELILEYESVNMPDTWGFLGRAYQVLPYASGNVINEVVELRPKHRNLIRWRDEPKIYYLTVRLVRYVKEGTMRVYESTPLARLTEIFSPFKPHTLFSMGTVVTNGTTYWRRLGATPAGGYVEVTIPPAFVEGRYDLWLYGRDAPNVNSRLVTSVSGFIIDTLELDAPVLAGFEHRAVEGFTFRAGMVLRINITTTGSDNGTLSLFKLIPTYP
jgi:hypothetical protein